MIRYYKNLLLTLSEIKGHPALLVHALTGCSFRCFHCFNFKELIEKNNDDYYLIDDVIKYVIRQKDLFEYVVFSGGEFLNAAIDDLRSDLKQVRKVSDKPIIIYTNGTNHEKMKILYEEGLVDGFHIDMKLPYHLLNEDDFDLVELTIGLRLDNLNLITRLLQAIIYAVESDRGYSKVRSVRYPFLSDTAFEENRAYIASLNAKFNKAVPYEVNDFIYEEE